MAKKAIIKKPTAPASVDVTTTRQIIADYYGLDLDEVLMNCVTTQPVCIIRQKVENNTGVVIGVRG